MLSVANTMTRLLLALSALGKDLNYSVMAEGCENFTKGFSELGNLPILESGPQNLHAGRLPTLISCPVTYTHQTQLISIAQNFLNNCLSLIFHAGPGMMGGTGVSKWEGLTAGLSEGDLVSLVSRVSFGISRMSEPSPSSASPSPSPASS